MGKSKAAHHRGAHQVTATRIVAAAHQQPELTCPRCGLTLQEGITKWGEQGQWEAGHRVAGDSSAGYQAEHRHCNRSHGAQLGNARRSTGYDWP